MKSNLYLIIRREYLERVSRKSFIITTILTPLFMLLLMVAPAAAMLLTGKESKTIAVVDNSGVIAPTLESDDEIEFLNMASGVDVDSLKGANDYDAILVIGRDIVDNPNNVQMYTHSAPSMQTEQFIRHQLEKTIENQRIAQYNIENLAQIMKSVSVNVQLSTYRLDTDEEESTSSIVSYLIGIIMAMMLYMFIMIYGQMVMTSIIEEKNNRVLEIIVSSVKPNVLMMGKILGIGAVALTQILIWGVLIGCFSTWVMPLINSSVDSTDADVIAALGQFSNTGFVFSLFGYLMLFLAGGYLLYSSIYAAIGSAVDNIQDASQLTTIAVVPIILGMVFSMTVIQDPTSNFAFWMSIIPLTSPMVMMARIPFGIPAWEIWLSFALLVVAFLFMIWLSAKIYRVGIFMYGKKPKLQDLIKWATYK